MEAYKAEFIEFLVRADVLSFGDYVTKSGRATPYFVNTGKYCTASQLARLGEFYAQALIDHLGTAFDNLYGPAYKGISLAVSTGMALSARHHHDVTVTFNRKEAKDHGEKGILLGHLYAGSERVVIIEDVITAGTSIRESLSILSGNGNPRISAVVVSVDRMERGQGALSAIEEVRSEYELEVFAIVNVREIIEFLYEREIDGKVVIDESGRERMEAHLAQYGS